MEESFVLEYHERTPNCAVKFILKIPTTRKTIVSENTRNSYLNLTAQMSLRTI